MPDVDEESGKQDEEGGTTPESDTTWGRESKIGDRSPEEEPGEGKSGEVYPLNDHRKLIQMNAVGRLAGFDASVETADRQYAVDRFNDEQQQYENVVDKMHWFRYSEYSLKCE